MRRSPLSCALTTVLMVSIGPVPMVARAQAAPQTSDAPPASNPSAAPSDDERVARELFEQGREAYTEGRFEDARELFERSYERSGRPELLYNIAQAAERTRDDEHALETYRAFLEALPDAPERDFVEARIVFLSERQRDRAAAASAQPSPGLDLGPAPVALLAGGGAVAVGGAALLAVALRGRNQVEGASEGSSYARVRRRGERARGLGYAGQVALGLGVAAAVTGAVLFALDGDGDGAVTAPASARVTVGVGLGHVSVSGSF